jgi:hypothetical protein
LRFGLSSCYTQYNGKRNKCSPQIKELIMFGFKKRAQVVVDNTTISSERATEVAAILETVGFVDTRNVIELLSSKSFYRSDLEYTERATGMRFFANLNAQGKVARIVVVTHGSHSYTDADAAEANVKLAAFFA